MTDPLETYILLFTDTLVSNLAFNISDELAISAMKIFDYNLYIVTLTASCAFMVASFINYGFGIICYNILLPLTSKRNEKNFNIIKVQRSKYVIIFLMLSALPFFGKFVMLFAGFCKIRPTLAIPVGTISRLVYYFIFMII